MSEENPDFVVTVGVDRGPELFRMTVSPDIAGRFLEDLGRRLMGIYVANMARKAAPLAGMPKDTEK